MTLLLTLMSVTAMVTSNCVLNKVCKKEFASPKDIHRFNTIVFGACILLFGGSLLIGGKISLFTVLLGILFGVLTCLNRFNNMLALSNGPMHITLLVTTASMIIPTMSGIFFGEAFIPSKLVAVVFLIFFIYLSLGKSGDSKFSKKWLIYCTCAFLAQGFIGVLQKIHQSSPYKSETNGFLLVAFAVSFIYTRIIVREKVHKNLLSKKLILLAVLIGVCSYANNFINLKLSGMLPSQLFFPLINGSSIVLSSVFSVLIFKEKLTKVQFIGLCGGILSLIAICLLR